MTNSFHRFLSFCISGFFVTLLFIAILIACINSCIGIKSLLFSLTGC